VVDPVTGELLAEHALSPSARPASPTSTTAGRGGRSVRRPPAEKAFFALGEGGDFFVATSGDHNLAVDSSGSAGPAGTPASFGAYRTSGSG
jgi:hypothetical protein